ncbi:MAG: BatD family protein, partial [Bacteroidales bacterium]|nr:BatD family protein [Bacteroidales bacterium]
MYKIFVSFALLLISSAFAMAQDVEVKMSAPGKVTAGQPFRIEVSVNSQKANINDPKLDDFQVYGRSQSTSMSIINGDMSVQKSFIYTAIANKPGTYTIKPASATQGGKTYESNSVTITVVDGGNAGQTAGQPQGGNNAIGNNQQQQTADDEITPSDSGDLFVDVISNKNDVYVGEQVILTSSLYSRYDIAGFEDAKFPNFNGFWAKDIKNPKNITFDRKRINNKVYLYSLWQKKALFPQKAGKLEIEPYTVNCVVTDGFGFRQARAVAKSKVKTINVKPLPDNKPEGFGGAVGNFKIQLSADKEQVKLDEPLTVKVTISGTGNFQLFESPKVQFNSAFEQFEPKSTENINATDAGINGSKTFSTVVIARQPGEYTIPAVKFSYFDPSAKAYKTIESKEIA